MAHLLLDFKCDFIITFTIIIILVAEDVNSHVIRQIHIQIRMQKIERIMSDHL